MSFLSRALKQAESFLEQVDESVGQASRRMALENATNALQSPVKATPEQDSDTPRKQRKTASNRNKNEGSGKEPSKRKPKVEKRSLGAVKKVNMGEKNVKKENGPKDPASSSQVREGWGGNSEIPVPNELASRDDGERGSQLSVDQTLENVDESSERTKAHSDSAVVVTFVSDTTDDPVKFVEAPSQDELNRDRWKSEGWDMILEDEGHVETTDFNVGVNVDEASLNETKQKISENDKRNIDLSFKLEDIEEPQVREQSINKVPSDESTVVDLSKEKENVSESAYIGIRKAVEKNDHVDQESTQNFTSEPEEPTGFVDQVVKQATPEMKADSRETGAPTDISMSSLTNNFSSFFSGVKASSKFPELEKNNDGNKNEGTKPRSTFNVSEAEYLKLKQQVQDLTELNEELSRDLEAIEEDFHDAQEEKSVLITRLNQTKEVIADIEEGLSKRTAELRETKSQLNDQVQVVADLNSKWEKDKFARRKEKDEFEKKIKLLELQLAQKTAELNAQVTHLEKENDRLNESLKQARERDISTADEYRAEAARMSEQLEKEIAAHNETRFQAQVKEEAAEQAAAFAAQALAASERKAEEDRLAMSKAQNLAREAENSLSIEKKGRIRLESEVEELRMLVTKYKHTEIAVESEKIDVSRLKKDLERQADEKALLEKKIEHLEITSKNLQDSLSRYEIQDSPEGLAMLEELRERLRVLADSNVRKQSQLEALKGEISALSHQLDSERKRMKELQSIAFVPQAKSLNDAERGGVHVSYKPSSSLPAPLSRILEAFDRVSVAGLRFLRSEPILRIAFLIYIIFMHLFIYVLLHYGQVNFYDEGMIRKMSDPQVQLSGTTLPGLPGTENSPVPVTVLENPAPAPPGN